MRQESCLPCASKQCFHTIKEDNSASQPLCLPPPSTWLLHWLNSIVSLVKSCASALAPSPKSIIAATSHLVLSFTCPVVGLSVLLSIFNHVENITKHSTADSFLQPLHKLGIVCVHLASNYRPVLLLSLKHPWARFHISTQAPTSLSLCLLTMLSYHITYCLQHQFQLVSLHHLQAHSKSCCISCPSMLPMQAPLSTW